MSFSQFLTILKARKWVALSVLLLVVVVTIAVSLVLPKQYVGTASVVVDVRPDPVSAVGLPQVALPGFMATQVDILTSERVSLRVIRDLRLAESPEIRRQWQDEGEGRGSIEQWLSDVLRKKLDVKPSRESNVIDVEYKAPDPRFAAGVANAFARAYIATTLDLRTNPAQNFSKFFDSRTKEARDALEVAQKRVSDFQREKGIIATDERFDVENARLNELSSQLTLLQSASADSSSRQSQASGSQADRMQEVLSNPVIGALKADLSRNEAKLQELSQRYGDAHPQVLELRANIAETRARIDAETRRVTSGVGVTNNINRQREGEIRRALEAQRSRVLQMKAVRDEGLVLQREVENAQRVYDGISGRLNQTMLEAQATQSYANLLTEALPPLEPSQPKPLLNALAAIFLGGLLAVGVVLLLEMTDRRVRSPADAVSALGLPVLGVLPTPKAKRFVAGNRALLTHVPSSRLVQLPAPNQPGGL